MERSSSRDRLILLFVWALGIAFLSCVAWRGWLPQDDGMLGHAAERVLTGELPHRDFDAAYTGGLELLHALAFKLFGIRLASIRIVMLVMASLFIPVFYSLVARVLSPVWSAVVTLVAVVWSLPVYFASMPSWHILFLSTFGMATLFRYFDTGHRRWLAATGALGGIAFLMKSNGLLFAAAAGLSLVFDEQQSSSERTEPKRVSLPAGLIWAGCGVLALRLIGIVARQPGVMELVHYAVPSLAIFVVLAITERRYGESSVRTRFARWWRVLAPFLLGLAVPVLLFLIPYVLSGSLRALYSGLFVLPQRRIALATSMFPSGWTLLWGTPLVLLLAFGSRIPANRLRVAARILALVLLPVAVLGKMPLDYEGVCDAARTLIPVAVFSGATLLLRAPAIAPLRRRELFVVLATAALASLLQYPFPAYVYFCYVLLLGVLAMAYVVVLLPAAPRPLFSVTAGFFALFGALWITPSSPAFVGRTPKHETYVPLELARAGIDVPETFAFYRELIEEVQKHSSAGDAI